MEQRQPLPPEFEAVMQKIDAAMAEVTKTPTAARLISAELGKLARTARAARDDARRFIRKITK